MGAASRRTSRHIRKGSTASSSSSQQQAQNSTTSKSATTAEQQQQSRPVHRTAGVQVAGDGVVWKERLAVVEGVDAAGNPRLSLRSYFRNPATRERVWDEPPSGASAVDFATPEMRKQAEVQKQELQFTLDLIPPDSSNKAAAQEQAPSKRGLLGRLGGGRRNKALKDDSKDVNLQRAIARSMADQRGGGGTSGSASSQEGDPRVLYDSEFSLPSRATKSSSKGPFDQHQAEDDEELAMAKALSLSAEASAGPSQVNASSSQATMTEEEMIRLAIEQSEREAHGVPPRPPQQLSVVSTSAPEDQQQAHSPSSKEKIGSFDPYSPHHSDSNTSRSTTPTAEIVEASSSIHKISDHDEHDMDRKHPGRRLSRKVFGGRRRMEAKAGVL